MDHLSQGITIILIATIFLAIIAVSIVALILYYQKQQVESKLQTQEEVLKKISQEIHDNIGQVLTLAKLNLSTLDFDRESELEEKINDTRQLISRSIQDLRNLSKILNTEFVSGQGLVESIQIEISHIKKHISSEVQFNINGVTRNLEPGCELRLFRIFQEAVTNIIKHANASNVSVILTYAKTSFIMEISDNGKGFDSESRHNPLHPVPGIGLQNMHDRACQIGARLFVQSIPGTGTNIKIVLPMGSTK